jgi:hypothetical protein
VNLFVPPVQVELRKNSESADKVHILDLFNALVVRHYFAMAVKDKNVSLFRDLGLTDEDIAMLLPEEEEEEEDQGAGTS